MKGKNKCKILKEIRQKIADENDIPYVTRECTYRGDCKGTCPKCEAELRYLEQELEKRRRLGKTVAVAAVAAGLSLSLAACTPGDGSGAGSGGDLSGAAVPSYTLPVPTDSNTERPLEGEPVELEGQETASTETPEPLLGEMPSADILDGMVAPAPTEEAPELMGDVVFLPETPEDMPATTAAPEN